MPNIRERRVMMELKRLNKEKESGILPPGWEVEPKSEEDLYVWKAVIPGARDTPYEYGLFEVEIKIGEKYPMKNPDCKFVTPIYHPNVGSDGCICVDILGSAWSPANSIKTLLISLQLLMECPEPDDPMESEIARIYKNDREEFNKKCKQHIRDNGVINPHFVDPDAVEEEKKEEPKAEKDKSEEVTTEEQNASPENATGNTIENATSTEIAISTETATTTETQTSTETETITETVTSTENSITTENATSSDNATTTENATASENASATENATVATPALVKSESTVSTKPALSRRQSSVYEMLEQHSNEIEKMDSIHAEMVNEANDDDAFDLPVAEVTTDISALNIAQRSASIENISVE